MHVDEDLLRPLIAQFGPPARLDWDGDVTEAEYRLATYNPRRRHDVTLFILDLANRIALIRKPHFAEGIWRPPGGGVLPGEQVVAGAVRESLEETGLRVEIERYLVDAHATFRWDGEVLPWRTHVLLARTADAELAPQDPTEIAGARWGTLDELAGPLRDRLLSTGRALWRYRVALHDAALASYSDG
ncbi:MAG TPA: NUDIX hydrolase [Gaiellaceae bacterium]|nr:NUDIX hydrolase [Gaiellaceae bacterium]